MDDYLYDGTYFARSSRGNFGAQQVSIQEGGFKVPVYNNVGRSDNWLAAVNLKADAPWPWVPLRLFFDAGIVPASTINQQAHAQLLYDGGVEVFTYKDIISLCLPIVMSDQFKDYLTNTFGSRNVFGRSVSFTLQLQNINWLKAPDKVLKTISN